MKAKHHLWADENDPGAKRLIEDSRQVRKLSSRCEFYIRKSKEIGEIRSNGIWSKSRIEKREQRLYEFFTKLHGLGKEYRANRET